MLKAIYHSQYRKKGTGALMYTYAITGTAIEVADYLLVQEAATARTPGTWPKADNGAPLWWLNVTVEKQSGGNPKQSYNLIFNRDKTAIIRDDSAEQMAASNRIAALKEEKIAELQAQIELGIIPQPSRGNSGMRVVATPASTQLVVPENKDLTDEIISSVGETITPEVVAAGDENLGD